MALLPRMNIARRSVENKAVGSNSCALHEANPTNARSVLSQVIKAPQSAMKPASKARAGWKIGISNQVAAAISDAVAARKPRVLRSPAAPSRLFALDDHVPRSPVAPSRLFAPDNHVPCSPVAPSRLFALSDPTPHVVRSSLHYVETAALSAAMQAAEAVVARVVGTAERRATVVEPERVVQARVSKYSTAPARRKEEAVVARAVGTAEVVKPAPLAGLKRRATVVEPERVVQARVSKYSTAPAGRREEDALTKPTAAVPDSAYDSADSQATVVEQDLPAEIKMCKIAKPSRAYSSLRTLAGQAAEAPPTVSSSSVASSSVAEFKLDVAQSLRDWDDIDAEDSDDPQMVSEYISDIIEYLRERELVTMPNPAYMTMQKKLTWDMRRELVNWIVKIHYQLRLLPETLFLAVNILDRFLCKRKIRARWLQLIGVTAVMVACKYGESVTPHLSDFIYLAGNSCTAQEILTTEIVILTALDFDMSYPNPMTFLRRVSKAEGYNKQTRAVAQYLMEVCIMDHRLMQYPPSKIAAAGIYLGRRMLESGPWTANLRHYSGYTEEEIEPLVAVMLDHVLATPDDEFVFRKYQKRRFLAASDFCFEWAAYHHQN
ncbi:G2/mitotic-specific cyclin [Coemansia sp. S680]|nr:G2/mitotic-specific cyclin [Coemansia sp. S680]